MALATGEMDSAEQSGARAGASLPKSKRRLSRRVKLEDAGSLAEGVIVEKVEREAEVNATRRALSTSPTWDRHLQTLSPMSAIGGLAIKRTRSLEHGRLGRFSRAGFARIAGVRLTASLAPTPDPLPRTPNHISCSSSAALGHRGRRKSKGPPPICDDVIASTAAGRRHCRDRDLSDAVALRGNDETPQETGA